MSRSPLTPVERRRRQSRRRGLLPVGLVLGVGLFALAWWVLADGGSGSGKAKSLTRSHTATARQRLGRLTAKPAPPRLVERRTAALPAPVQDAAVAALDSGREILLGGLTAQDTSTDTVLVASAGGAHRLGRLPAAVHDAAAVRLGGAVYLFGGGSGVRQTDAIVRVDAGSGATATAGRLPAPSSDQAAASVQGMAYVVGGYTGSRWLDTIVAWRPGAAPHVVAHLPSPVRYAAVTAVGDGLVIAGGSLPNGTASDTVLEFLPATGRLVRIGRLPAPTTHAAAAALGDVAYVIGGRGAAVGSATGRVVAVDLGSRRILPGGRLSTPRSDLAAAAIGTGILLAGGRGARGAESELSALVPHVAAPSARPSRPAVPATAKVNIYAFDRANELAPTAAAALPRIYVPNSQSATVDVIDPRTYKIVEHFPVGALPQHVTPAYDLKTLYVTNDLGNSLTPINPRTGRPGKPIPVDDPYNMYFTPNGRYAIVVAERLRRLDFRDAHSFRLHRSLAVPCVGVDHMDFSADGRYLLASCEFSGQIVKVDVRRERVVGVLNLPDGRAGMPQDVKLSADGRVFYVADLHANGLWELNGDRLKVIGFLRTGAGVHGLYPSRDGRFLYATNRGEGSISVISFSTRRVVAKWRIPGGGSPDMGGVSANGRVLWLSGRYNGVVYAISTRNGRLLARISVGQGPHGLCVWPQPGRYSLGHTGELR
ncbi:MAG: YncE family protein [Gaiellaceae bacterium]